MKSLPHLEKHTEQKEYKHVRTLRFATILLFGFLAYLVLHTVLFVYRNIYESIASAESIILLKSELGASVIDFERLHRVSAAWHKKQAAVMSIPSWDPFFEEDSATSTNE